MATIKVPLHLCVIVATSRMIAIIIISTCGINFEAPRNYYEGFSLVFFLTVGSFLKY